MNAPQSKNYEYFILIPIAFLRQTWKCTLSQLSQLDQQMIIVHTQPIENVATNALRK